jgi:hypothetical protein
VIVVAIKDSFLRSDDKQMSTDRKMSLPIWMYVLLIQVASDDVQLDGNLRSGGFQLKQGIHHEPLFPLTSLISFPHIQDILYYAGKKVIYSLNYYAPASIQL